MKIFKILQLLLFFISAQVNLYSSEVIDLSSWDEPILMGNSPVLVKNTFAIVAMTDLKVKVYDVSNGLQDPHFLWSTPGVGQGPGELPQNTQINNIAIDQENHDLWVSHFFGLQIFSRKGVMKHQFTLPFNRSWVKPINSGFLLSGRRPLFDGNSILFFRKIPTSGKYDDLDRFSNWIVKRPLGLPLVKGGIYLAPAPEIYHFNKQYYLFDFPSKELLQVDSNGQIMNYKNFLNALPEIVNPVSYDGELAVFNSTYTENKFVLRATGMVEYNGNLWTTLFVPSKGNGEFPERVFAKLSMDGDVIARYSHSYFKEKPSLIYLFHERDGLFFLMNMVEFDKIMIIPISELKEILR